MSCYAYKMAIVSWRHRFCDVTSLCVLVASFYQSHFAAPTAASPPLQVYIASTEASKTAQTGAASCNHLTDWRSDVTITRIRHGTGSHFVTQRPSVPESSDPETQLTRWPCSIMNSKCRLMLQTNVCNGQEVCQFLSLFGVCTLLEK